MPRDLFILGTGRSGTSLTAGLFRRSGYYQASSTYAPRESNPLGFFEDVAVNALNEAILTRFALRSWTYRGAAFTANTPGRGQNWLARIPVSKRITAPRRIEGQIATILAHRPFCLKDPRFCYTLPVWRAQAPSARIICVFRKPRVVVSSMLREVSSVPYLQGFALSQAGAFEIWKLMYGHALKNADVGTWAFVNYDDLFVASTLDRLAEFSEAEVDKSFPSAELNRSEPVEMVDPDAEALYENLLKRSGETLGQTGMARRLSHA